VLERVQRKRERDYEDRRNCKQAPAEAGAQCHFKGMLLSVLSGGFVAASE
jgi:hypothetical protein